MALVKSYEFPILGDERGSLVALEDGSGVPFSVRRIYFIFGTPQGVSRGFHAHKKLHQMAFCLSGQCRMVIDDGTSKEEIVMDSPATGVDLPPMIWHEMHDFSEDCVLLVLASLEYEEDDYIRDYTEFQNAVRL